MQGLDTPGQLTQGCDEVGDPGRARGWVWERLRGEESQWGQGCSLQPGQARLLPGSLCLLSWLQLWGWACPYLPLALLSSSWVQRPPTPASGRRLRGPWSCLSGKPVGLLQGPSVRKCRKRKRVAGQDERAGGRPQCWGRLQCGCCSRPRRGAGDRRRGAAGGTEADVALPLLGCATDPSRGPPDTVGTWGGPGVAPGTLVPPGKGGGTAAVPWRHRKEQGDSWQGERRLSCRFLRGSVSPQEAKNGGR